MSCDLPVSVSLEYPIHAPRWNEGGICTSFKQHSLRGDIGGHDQTGKGRSQVNKETSRRDYILIPQGIHKAEVDIVYSVVSQREVWEGNQSGVTHSQLLIMPVRPSRLKGCGVEGVFYGFPWGRGRSFDVRVEDAVRLRLRVLEGKAVGVVIADVGTGSDIIHFGNNTDDVINKSTRLEKEKIYYKGVVITLVGVVFRGLSILTLLKLNRSMMSPL